MNPLPENIGAGEGASVSYTPAFQFSSRGWIRSPAWDLFWMFAAVWGCGLLLLASSVFGMATAGAVFFFGNLLIGICHSWSTTFMVIGSRLLRNARAENRLKFTIIPLVLVLGSLLLGAAMGAIGGFPTAATLTGKHTLWVVYLGLFWVGHFWHFGNQDFGVLSIYRTKAGQKSVRDRHVDKAYAVAMMFVIQPCVYFKSATTSPLSTTIFSLVPVSRAFVDGAATVCVVTAVILSVCVVAYELRKDNTSIPKLLYYAVMLAHPTVLYFLQFGLGFFYMISYFWSHWFIAIGLVGRVNTGFQRSQGVSASGSLLRHMATIGGIAALVWVFYRVFPLSVFSGKDYKELLAAVAPEYTVVAGLVLGVFLAEQLLHYYCDRCLFRFRDPSVRKAVGPLI